MPDPVIVTPSLPAWPPAAQAAAADELERCGDCPALVQALGDYIGLRDAIRAAAP